MTTKNSLSNFNKLIFNLLTSITEINENFCKKLLQMLTFFINLKKFDLLMTNKNGRTFIMEFASKKINPDVKSFYKCIDVLKNVESELQTDNYGNYLSMILANNISLIKYTDNNKLFDLLRILDYSENHQNKDGKTLAMLLIENTDIKPEILKIFKNKKRIFDKKGETLAMKTIKYKKNLNYLKFINYDKEFKNNVTNKKLIDYINDYIL